MKVEFYDVKEHLYTGMVPNRGHKSWSSATLDTEVLVAVLAQSHPHTTTTPTWSILLYASWIAEGIHLTLA